MSFALDGVRVLESAGAALGAHGIYAAPIGADPHVFIAPRSKEAPCRQIVSNRRPPRI
jgi:hypothetical protein